MARYKDGVGLNSMRSIGFSSVEQHGHTSSLQQCTGDGTHSVDFFRFQLNTISCISCISYYKMMFFIVKHDK